MHRCCALGWKPQEPPEAYLSAGSRPCSYEDIDESGIQMMSNENAIANTRTLTEQPEEERLGHILMNLIYICL